MKKVAASLAVLLMTLVMLVVFVVGGSKNTGCEMGGGGAIAAAGSWIKPTDPAQTQLSSPFGERWGAEHKGIDLAGPEGTPIYAFTDGRVADAGEADGFGHWIVLDHVIEGRTMSTVYGHMWADGVLVSAGDQVSAGQRIASIGNDGQSTGAHLHFEVWDGGRSSGSAVDPQSWYDKAAAPGTSSAPPAPGPTTGESSAPAGTAGLNAAQLAMAHTVVAVGEVMGISEHGIVVALATASQESGFRMYANDGTGQLAPDQRDVSRSMDFPHDAVGNDHGSVNQFQQQYPWWGSLEELMNPASAARKFYDALLTSGDWESRPVTVAAQTVQVSAYPDAYADDEPLARTLASTFTGAGASMSPEQLEQLSASGALTVAAGGGGLCATDPSNPDAPAYAPNGPFGQNVIAAASRWLGTTYVWGGGDTSGPTGGGFDCSGLTMYAVFVASEGKISLPHYTGDPGNPGQLDDPRGQEIAFDHKQPGDLIFFGSGRSTHHVAIFYGTENGQDMILHAPQTGDVVKIAPLSGFTGEEMYVKRFG
ncbi:peptidoglycan DD-metalloendopeptidase family protein [Rhodococcus sp. BH5]|uniref:peptidoglycan DD-metalloendopeptidase family protein n=1 Tax=Rhodococcus sp. BH5 TaxID=2871702 RepID=UPI0022CD4A24|nr:peptidoglycan DD-metalloendopeptidase family protein [Rhodococcus sp. BH5]MCZ9635040.1 peptidoglycan DD-metalloendopeptidase family protein [Rhodococcus sp. BH5]